MQLKTTTATFITLTFQCDTAHKMLRSALSFMEQSLSFDPLQSSTPHYICPPLTHSSIFNPIATRNVIQVELLTAHLTVILIPDTSPCSLCGVGMNFVNSACGSAVGGFGGGHVGLLGRLA